ncbi:MAG: Rrf2 family transcriptional regulator [Rhodospirillales bacterium]|jgi:Rrf2 family protein|nr:transcriptional regulator [Rhodospirillaceae bacterium]MDP6426897.1 Rrf2 family transcriptional regulator [Rhodospirillales bacterium]MDP6643716.1 Rrf2 family transcriptional regulator [Rhodospirillales bacterium]MDP6842770.1 Rrf2 family transcriptional regulator [Rhodospirillales bacterium]|tara:strand:- start:860 stop:1312 length:453 start_codon:yes stop_codon:yes gene_type:complete
MRLQKATLFGLYSVLELARHPERQLSATDIADIYGISANHLAKVLRDLGRAGLVDSVRGAGGGYRFSGNARRTTLLDIINIFEDIGSDGGGAAARGEDTDIGGALLMVQGEIDDIARATFGSITVSTLLKTMQWYGGEAGSEAETAADAG